MWLLYLRTVLLWVSSASYNSLAVPREESGKQLTIFITELSITMYTRRFKFIICLKVTKLRTIPQYVRLGSVPSLALRIMFTTTLHIALHYDAPRRLDTDTRRHSLLSIFTMEVRHCTRIDEIHCTSYVTFTAIRLSHALSILLAGSAATVPNNGYSITINVNSQYWRIHSIFLGIMFTPQSR